MKLRKSFLYTILTLIVVIIAGFFVSFLAKGYRISTKTGTITGTGIISVNSTPDQASVYLDNHLTAATNSTINSLTPKKYTVKIVKEGYINWEKQIEVKEGLVSEIKATLYRTIPTVYPLTYTGAGNILVSPDSLKMVYVVPDSEDPNLISSKKSGLWVWPMSDRGISFGRGNEPKQIGASAGLDYSKAQFRWSPDSTQVLATFPDRDLLFDIDKFNDPPRDITAISQVTLKSWDSQQKSRDLTKLQSIKDIILRKTASDSAVLKWSPDETKVLYSPDGQSFKITDLVENKQYELPKLSSAQTKPKTASESAQLINWMPDSEHLVLAENLETRVSQTSEPSSLTSSFPLAKISIIEIDGFNKSEIYVGNLDPQNVVVWPDSSRLVIISSLPTATASKPNLFGINLK